MWRWFTRICKRPVNVSQDSSEMPPEPSSQFPPSVAPGRHQQVWLELNKIGVWLCDWEVLEVVVEGAVGDVGGEGREGFLRGVALEVGDVVLGGVPYVFRGTQGRGRRGRSGPWCGGTWRCPGRRRSSFLPRSLVGGGPVMRMVCSVFWFPSMG